MVICIRFSLGNIDQMMGMYTISPLVGVEMSVSVVYMSGGQYGKVWGRRILSKNVYRGYVGGYEFFIWRLW